MCQSKPIKSLNTVNGKKIIKLKPSSIVIIIIIVYVILFPFLNSHLYREMYYYKTFNEYKELVTADLYNQYGNNFEIIDYEISYYQPPLSFFISTRIKGINFKVYIPATHQETNIWVDPLTSSEMQWRVAKNGTE